MADTEAMVRRRRLDSELKHLRVLAELKACAQRGQSITKAELARRAGVDRSLLYSEELRSEIERCLAEIERDLGGQAAAAGRVTTASLRADLANYKAQNQRLRAQVAALERRLSQAMGAAFVADLAPDLAMQPDAGSRERVFQLEAQVADAQEESHGLAEELEAVRAVNRKLMARLNVAPVDR